MKVTGRKILSKTDIDKIVIKVLNHFDTSYFDKLRNCPIEKIVTNLSESGHLNYYPNMHLGFANGNRRILGCYQVNSHTIYLDETLIHDENKLRFVLAHELGHFVLHRKIIYEEIENERLEDTEEELTGRKKLVTELDFIEWQANYFAASILMQSDMFKVALRKVRTDLNISRRDSVYVDDQRVTQKDYYDTLEGLSNYFKVSRMAIDIRLKNLGLLEDNRMNNTSSLSDVMQEILSDIAKRRNET